MRWVVVVFRASMWAMMPMSRPLSSGYLRAIFVSATSLLVPKMTEGLVALSHLVRLFPPLDRGPHPVSGVHELAGELLLHTLPRSGPGVTYDPAPGQRRAAVRPDLDRDLVGGAADPAGLDPQNPGGGLEGGVEDPDRGLLPPPPDAGQRARDDPPATAPLSPLHHHR